MPRKAPRQHRYVVQAHTECVYDAYLSVALRTPPPRQDVMRRLGVLAVTCGDGHVRIVPVPYPAEVAVPEGTCTGHAASHVHEPYDAVYDCTPCTGHTGVKVVKLGTASALHVPAMCSGSALCCDWSRVDGCALLAIGGAEGIVSLCVSSGGA